VSERGAGSKRRSGACGGGWETRDVGASVAGCEGEGLGKREREMCPWAISKYFGD
jgi:hypothetical protein